MVIPRNKSKPLTEVIAPPVEPEVVPATVVVNQAEEEESELDEL